jgi:hypothetical protein
MPRRKQIAFHAGRFAKLAHKVFDKRGHHRNDPIRLTVLVRRLKQEMREE